jgi:hypothetical protein
VELRQLRYFPTVAKEQNSLLQGAPEAPAAAEGLFRQALD